MGNIFLSLGSNMGDRLSYLQQAIILIEEKVGELLSVSSVYETESWGTSAPDYLNQVVELSTTLSPRDLLSVVLAIENQLGRVRVLKWGDRVIDIDILFYDSVCISEQDLIVPHPLLAKRRFVLLPLQEIANSLEHPTLKKSIAELVALCEDASMVKRIS